MNWGQEKGERGGLINHLTTCSESLDEGRTVESLFKAAGCAIHHCRQAS